MALPGHFNVSNALAALAAAVALGVSAPAAAARSPRPERVPGRFEPVDEGQGFAVLVDYAHTPDSLENVLRRAPDRDRRAPDLRLRLRRRPRPREAPADGPIGAELADVPVVTSDNPRSEDPEAIIAEILTGVEGGRDRRRGRGRPPRRDPRRSRWPARATRS